MGRIKRSPVDCPTFIGYCNRHDTHRFPAKPCLVAHAHLVIAAKWFAAIRILRLGFDIDGNIHCLLMHGLFRTKVLTPSLFLDECPFLFADVIRQFRIAVDCLHQAVDILGQVEHGFVA